MNDVDLEAVKLKAYQIWEREGRVDGQHCSHWQQALEELGRAQPVDPAREAIAAQTRQWDESEEES